MKEQNQEGLHSVAVTMATLMILTPKIFLTTSSLATIYQDKEEEDNKAVISNSISKLDTDSNVLNKLMYKMHQ